MPGTANVMKAFPNVTKVETVPQYGLSYFNFFWQVPTDTWSVTIFRTPPEPREVPAQMMGLQKVLGRKTNRPIDRHRQRCLLRVLNKRSNSIGSYFLCSSYGIAIFHLKILRTERAYRRFGWPIILSYTPGHHSKIKGYPAHVICLGCKRCLERLEIFFLPSFWLNIFCCCFVLPQLYITDEDHVRLSPCIQAFEAFTTPLWHCHSSSHGVCHRS